MTITWAQMYAECQGQQGNIKTARNGTVNIIIPKTGYSAGTTYMVSKKENQRVTVNPKKEYWYHLIDGESGFEDYWALRMSPTKESKLTPEEIEQLKKRSAETWIV